MLINGFRLQDETVIEIGKFTILWNIFENYECHNRSCQKEIRNIADNITIDIEKQTNLAKRLNEHRNWLSLSVIDYVKQVLHSDNSDKSTDSNIELMCNFLEQTGENINCGCLLAIQRIRNNLIHGIKSVAYLNEQIDLFRAVNAVLESIEDK